MGLTAFAIKVRFEDLHAIGRDDRLRGRRRKFREARDARCARPVRLIARPQPLGRCRGGRGREEATAPAALAAGGGCCCHEVRRGRHRRVSRERDGL